MTGQHPAPTPTAEAAHRRLGDLITEAEAWSTTLDALADREAAGEHVTRDEWEDSDAAAAHLLRESLGVLRVHATATAPGAPVRVGYTCKRCGFPAPIGVGYTTTVPGAYEDSAARSSCPCGASRTP